MKEKDAPVVKIQKRVRTPTVMQIEAVECGAASLAMVLEYYGRIVSLEELRESCGVSRDGVKASNIVKAARRYGFQAKGYRKEPDDLDNLSVPMIIHWNFNHFLVLEGLKKDKVYLNDPAMGPRTVSFEEFNLAFTGVALELIPGPEFKPGGAKRSLLRSLKARFQDPLALLFVFLAGFFLVLPGLVTPIFSKVFVDNVLIKSMDGWFRPLLIGMLIATCLKGFLTWLQRFFLARYEIKLAINETSKYFYHLLQLPIGFFSQRLAGDLGKRVRNNDRVAKLLTGRLATSALSMVTVIFYLALMLFFDLTLTFIGIAIALLNLLILKWVGRAREEKNLRLVLELGKVYGTGASGLRLIETLKATGSESDFFAKWAGYHAKLINTSQDLGRLNYFVAIIPPFLTHFNTSAILVIGALKVINGDLTIGMLVAFQSLMSSFIGPFNDLVRLGGELQEVKGTMIQLDDVYRNKKDTSCENRVPLDAENARKLSGALEIRDLKFGYNILDAPFIEGFNLRLEPGARVALVGGSGSGKSTVAKLVSGIYHAWDGEILFDGRPRSQYPRETVVNSMAVIDQEISLFEGTIRDNLTLWDATIPDERIIQAAKDSHIHEEITSRPGGYDSRVSEGGSNFSGGQRQRLEIGRGLMLDPTILILDEATSALDAQTEKLIDGNLRRRGCTCLIVAHRLSTIRDCDEIIVMERGKIVQRGTHPELAQQEGHYANLIKTM